MSDVKSAPKPRARKAPAGKPKPEPDQEPQQVPAPVAAIQEDVNPLGVAFRRTVAHGDGGERVRVVQRALARAGCWDGPVDGRFGIMLARAVRSWQSQAGFRVTGEVTPECWEAMTR